MILRGHLSSFHDFYNCFPELKLGISIDLGPDLREVNTALYGFRAVTFHTRDLKYRTNILFECDLGAQP